jgi:CDP-diacylglycerol--serine O-phosphatidyltransferase
MLETEVKQKKFASLPISRLFPNIITIMAICFGLTSVRYALDEKWEIAVAFIIIAGFLDIVDGRLARFLKATSNFGAQLDSLADFVNFGISPAIIIYLWELHKIQIKGLGWALALFYTICSAIRLARFNSDLVNPERPIWKEGFFTGVPAPAGAYLTMIPIMLSFETSIISYIHPIIIGLYLVVVGVLMASRIPTFATKKLVIRKEYISLILVLAGLLIGFIIMQPWISLPLFGLLYLSSFPFSIKSFQKMSSTNSL